MKDTQHTIKCKTPLCNGKIGEMSITGLCKSCYSSIYNWTKKTPKQQSQRAAKLQLYESRLNFLLPQNKIRMINGKKITPLHVLPGQVKAYRKRTKYKITKGKIGNK